MNTDLQLRRELVAWKSIAFGMLNVRMADVPNKQEALNTFISALRAATSTNETNDLALTMELCIDDLLAHAREQGWMPK